MGRNGSIAVGAKRTRRERCSGRGARRDLPEAIVGSTAYLDPGRRLSARAHGFSDRKEFGPRSSGSRPCSRWRCCARRSRDSISVRSRRSPARADPPPGRWAALSPAMPPPTTTSFMESPAAIGQIAMNPDGRSPRRPVKGHPALRRSTGPRVEVYRNSTVATSRRAHDEWEAPPWRAYDHVGHVRIRTDPRTPRGSGRQRTRAWPAGRRPRGQWPRSRHVRRGVAIAVGRCAQ